MAYPRPLPDPFSCKACGIDRWNHGRRYEKVAGVHTWIRPSDRRILARMISRRLLRLNSRKDVA